MLTGGLKKAACFIVQKFEAFLSVRWSLFYRELRSKDTVMQLFNEIQQFRTGAGADKRATGLATGFCQLRMSAAQAPSKYAKTGVRFGSTGSSHGIPPNLEGIMTQNVTIRNEINNRGEGNGLIPA